jgi:hypothetical protein
MTAEPKMKVVSPTPVPVPSADEIAAANALASEARDLALEDFSFPGAPIDFIRDEAKWERKIGGAVEEIDAEHPYIPDLWSYVLVWNCWKTGKDGKRKKVAIVGPVRRIDAVALPAREALPDRNEDEWEIKNDRPQDPWSKQYMIVFKNPANGDLLVWRCGFEGRATLATLFKTYAQGVREHPGAMPEITFSSTKSYGFDGKCTECTAAEANRPVAPLR